MSSASITAASCSADPSALDLNRSSFNKILFRPRILVDVDQVDSSTSMLGQPTSMPVSTTAPGPALTR